MLYKIEYQEWNTGTKSYKDYGSKYVSSNSIDNALYKISHTLHNKWEADCSYRFEITNIQKVANGVIR